MLILFLFPILILSKLFTIKPTNFKNLIEFPKNMIETLIWSVYLSFSNCVGFDEIMWLCAFTKYTKICNTAIIYINELILTPFSPLDIRCKKLNALHSIMGGAGWPLIPFRNFVNRVANIQFKPYATTKMEHFVKRNR